MDKLMSIIPGMPIITRECMAEVETLSDVVLETIILASCDRIQVLLAQELYRLRHGYHFEVESPPPLAYA